MDYTTEERIAQKYLLPDGRLVRIMTSKRFRPVKVEMKNGVLYVNDLRLVLLDLNFHERGQNVDCVASLKEMTTNMGDHFPGVYLFDLLLKFEELVPIFPVGCYVVFLGSRAVIHTEIEVDKPLHEEVVKEKSLKALLKKFFKLGKEPKKQPPAQTSFATKVEVGFFALNNYAGVITPAFVSEEQFVNLVLSRHPDYFVFEARP